MKTKLIAIPFHCLYPKAPKEFVGCLATIAVYDPAAPDRKEEVVRKAQLHTIRTAYDALGKVFKGCRLPKTVQLPIDVIERTELRTGTGTRTLNREQRHLGVKRFLLSDLATRPFCEVHPYA